MVGCGFRWHCVSVNEIIVGIQADRPHEKINIWRGHCVGLVQMRNNRGENAREERYSACRWTKGQKSGVFLLLVGDVGYRGFSFRSE